MRFLPYGYQLQSCLTELKIWLEGGEPLRYRCTQRSPESWMRSGEVSKQMSYYLILSGCVFLFFDILIIVSLQNEHYQRSSCFRILSFLAVIQLFQIIIFSFWPAYMVSNGYVYCNHWIIEMIIGKVLMVFWTCGSFGVILLALNRFTDMTHHKGLYKFFKNKLYINILFGVTFIYGLICSMLTDPLLYNSAYKAYIYNPINGIDNTVYSNNVGLINDLFTLFALCSIHLYMFWLMFKGYDIWRSCNDLRKSVYFQTLILTSLYCIPTFCYVRTFNRESDVVKFYVSLVEIVYQLNACLPSVTLIVLCSTVRHDVMRLLRIPQYMAPKVTNPTISRSLNTA